MHKAVDGYFGAQLLDWKYRSKPAWTSENSNKLSDAPFRRHSLDSEVPDIPSRALPLSVILLIALAVHGPLLLMQLPAGSYDANTHIFFAAHYAHHGSIRGT